jgi:putative transposase
MTVRTTESQRRMFYGLHLAGQTYPEIAQRFGVSRECVRYWCRRQRDEHGCVTRHVGRAPGHLRGYDPLVRYCILRLKCEHPRWGPQRIRFHLSRRPSLQGLDLPSPASIGRYLHQWPRFRRKRKFSVAQSQVPRARHAHDVWQIDFKVGIPFGQGEWLHLHTVRDPYAGAYIGGVLYLVPSARSQVRPEQVRSTLRRCFQHWGTLPNRIQTDGETGLVNLHQQQAPFPAPFTLWLVGLGIEHVVIQHVTQNAHVERCHRSLHDYAIVGQRAASLPELQRLLDQALHELNAELPSRAHGCHGQPPLRAHPELLLPRRPYQQHHELACFDLHHVDAYLATRAWQRIPDANGVVQMGGHTSRYSVGRACAQQPLNVHYDPSDRHFVFCSPADPTIILRRCLAKNLDAAHLTGLTASPAELGPQQLPLPLVFHGVCDSE